MATHQLSTFHLAGHLMGIEVLKVQEVLRAQRMTAVPLAPPEIRGLVNLRGQIVTALDLRRRLGLPDRGEGDPAPVNVVVRTEEGPVSLLVDGIGDVVTVDDAQLELLPETLQGVARTVLLGAYELDGRVLLALDTEQAVSLAA